MKETKEIKSFYDDFVNYLVKDKLLDNPRHLNIFRLLDGWFKQYTFKSALEIGCGIGIISGYIKTRVPSVTSVDISETNIEFAKETVPGVSFIACDFLAADLKEKFDFITLFDVMEHFPKPLHPALFEKIHAYSHPGTLLAITIPDADCLDYFRIHNPAGLQVVDESITFDEVYSLTKKHGMEIITFTKFGIDYENQYRLYLIGYPREYKLVKVQPGGNPVSVFFRKVMRRIKGVFRKMKYGSVIRKFASRAK